MLELEYASLKGGARLLGARYYDVEAFEETRPDAMFGRYSR